MNQIINEDMRQGYSSVNPVNILVSASAFDDDLVNRIAKMDGVRQAEGVWRFAARARSSPDEWVTIELKAIPDIENMEINITCWPEISCAAVTADRINYDQNKIAGNKIVRGR